jgi:Txe/YoeB family toxin of Txe-Axe toxin-antitoxin module
VEIKKREELHLKYKKTLDTIEKEFKLKEEELSVMKKKKIKQIIKNSKENPHEINKKIEDLFGFTRVN